MIDIEGALDAAAQHDLVGVEHRLVSVKPPPWLHMVEEQEGRLPTTGCSALFSASLATARPTYTTMQATLGALFLAARGNTALIAALAREFAFIAGRRPSGTRASSRRAAL